jgi:hypothetical protein
LECNWGSRTRNVKNKVLPGIEPGLPEDTDAKSESGVITATYKAISGGK